MPLGLVSAMSAVPWASLIEKAPGAIDTANRLLRSVRKSRVEPPADGAISSQAATVAVLSAQVEALEASLGVVTDQFSEATILIQGLTEGNAALLIAVQQNRRWLIGLSLALLLSLLTAGFALLR